MTEQFSSPETHLSAEQVLHAGNELLEHFGVLVNPIDQPEAFAEAMDQLNPRFKGERPLVRFELEADQTQWPEDTKAIIMRAAESTRMLEKETPLKGDFEVVIALGAARQAPLDRARYAAKAAGEGTATYRQLIVGGSERQLPEAEQEVVTNYAPGSSIEFDLSTAAAKVVARETGRIVSLGYVEGERADTAAVIGSVLTALRDGGGLKESARIGAVTTQIYQTATALDVARAAKQFGITETFTAGNPSDPNIVAKRTISTYLSEVLRTMKAASLSQAARR